MQSVLKKFMKLGCIVRLTTSAVRNGENIGITGRIVEITQDPFNPTVTVEWSSNKPHVPRTGQVSYGIKYIVTAQRWNPHNGRPVGPSICPDDVPEMY